MNEQAYKLMYEEFHAKCCHAAELEIQRNQIIKEIEELRIALANASYVRHCQICDCILAEGEQDTCKGCIQGSMVAYENADGSQVTYAEHDEFLAQRKDQIASVFCH